jgi:hypothetical protein
VLGFMLPKVVRSLDQYSTTCTDGLAEVKAWSSDSDSSLTVI